jgi:mono/diheme cytochrome c family protein
MKRLPRFFVYTALVLVALSLIPLALIARARLLPSTSPRIQIVQDMGQQPKLKTQSANPLFADGRAMRPPVSGTIARGALRADAALYEGKANGAWITALPVAVSEQLMRRGRERYDIFCAPCHGLAGYGDGVVAKRAEALQEGTWTPPSSFHTDLVRSRPVGDLYNTVANGVRNMPGYGAQIPVEDRWAIVAYVRALQRSQHARIDDVPAELRGSLR